MLIVNPLHVFSEHSFCHLTHHGQCNFSADSIDPFELVGPTPSIAVPVSFAKGFVNYSNPNVISGFLQLRAFDKDGASYAMCPGVRCSGYLAVLHILLVSNTFHHCNIQLLDLWRRAIFALKASFCKSITRQSIVLESCSNPQKTWGVFQVFNEKKFLGFGFRDFFEWRHKWGKFRPVVFNLFHAATHFATQFNQMTPFRKFPVRYM